MSDETTKLLERLAALEAKLSANKAEPASGVMFDKRRATLDPIGYFKELGLDNKHIARHYVADTLGKDCPPELATMVQIGPQIAATSHLEEQLASLSRKVEEVIKGTKTASLKTTTVDSAKYPTLAAAIKADSTILDRELAKIGDVADTSVAFAKIEENLAPYAKAFGFKTPTTPSDSHAHTSLQTPDGGPVKPEIKPASALAGEVPSLLATPSSGALTADEHDRLKSAVLKKHNLVRE